MIGRAAVGWQRRLHLALLRLDVAVMTIVEGPGGRSNLQAVWAALPAPSATEPRLEFAGIDTLNLSFGALKRYALATPERVQTVDLGIRNAIFTNLRTGKDFTPLVAQLALQGGLGWAKEQLVLGDGIAWIWNLKASRWPAARELLDFWHGSQHLWSLGHACHGRDSAAVQPWVEQRLHDLRHGREQRVLKGIRRLKVSRSQAGQIVGREKNYFAGHAGRMNYQAITDRGWPIGSGPVESSCRQDQRRFKGPGQSWSAEGFDHLSALDQARRNNHWDELWLTT